MNAREFRRMLLPLLGFATALVLLPALLLTGLTRATGVDIVGQAKVKQAAIVATELADDLQRALATGMAPGGIPSVEHRFGQLMQQYPGIHFLALLGPDGRVLQSAGLAPQHLLPLVRQSDGALRTSLRAAGGMPVPVTVDIGELSVTRFFLRAPDGAKAELAYGLRRGDASELLSRQTPILAAMLAILLLLGLPVLYATARGTLRQPLRRLCDTFDCAAAGDFRFAPAERAHSEAGSLARAWNNEILSLHERRSQIAAFAADALEAADDPAVAREIEELAQSPELGGAPSEAGHSGGTSAELLRLPLMALAFLAAAAFGNTPQWPVAAAGAVALAAGLATARLSRPRSAAGAAAVAAGVFGLAALAMLVCAIRPAAAEPQGLAITEVAVATLLLGLLAGYGMRPGAGLRPLRRGWAALLLHVAAGLLAAAVWTLAGPSGPGDTAEAWAGAILLSVGAAALWWHRP